MPYVHKCASVCMVSHGRLHKIRHKAQIGSSERALPPLHLPLLSGVRMAWV